MVSPFFTLCDYKKAGMNFEGVDNLNSLMISCQKNNM